MIIFVLCFVFMGAYVLCSLQEKYPKWFPQSKKSRDLETLQKTYQTTRNCRRQALQHYYWAQSSNQQQKMARLEKQIQKMDQQLKDLKSQYQLVRIGKAVPLKCI